MKKRYQKNELQTPDNERRDLSRTQEQNRTPDREYSLLGNSWADSQDSPGSSFDSESMKKLEQYNYFVGSTQNMITGSQDGTVIRKS